MRDLTIWISFIICILMCLACEASGLWRIPNNRYYFWMHFVRGPICMIVTLALMYWMSVAFGKGR